MPRNFFRYVNEIRFEWSDLIPRKDPITTAIVGFRLYHNTVYIEDFEMDNVDLLNIDVGALGPDWKSRSYSSQKSDLIYIFHTCPLPVWL